MTQSLQLADFLAAVSAAEDEDATLRTALEQAIEIVGAHAGAVLERSRSRVAVSPTDPVPHVELLAVCAGGTRAPIPGIGLSPATAVELEHPAQAHLVVVRAGDD